MCSFQCRDSFDLKKFTACIKCVIVINPEEYTKEMLSNAIKWAKMYELPYFKVDSDGTGGIEFLYGLVDYVLPVVEEMESAIKNMPIQSITKTEQNKTCCIS